MGVRKWVKRPTVGGYHVGVEDLTEGQQGVPVRRVCRGDIQPLLMNLGIQATEMGLTDYRCVSVPGVGRRCSRHWLLD